MNKVSFGTLDGGGYPFNGSPVNPRLSVCALLPEPPNIGTMVTHPESVAARHLECLLKGADDEWVSSAAKEFVKQSNTVDAISAIKGLGIAMASRFVLGAIEDVKSAGALKSIVAHPRTMIVLAAISNADTAFVKQIVDGLDFTMPPGNTTTGSL